MRSAETAAREAEQRRGAQQAAEEALRQQQDLTAQLRGQLRKAVQECGDMETRLTAAERQVRAVTPPLALSPPVLPYSCRGLLRVQVLRALYMSWWVVGLLRAAWVVTSPPPSPCAAGLTGGYFKLTVGNVGWRAGAAAAELLSAGTRGVCGHAWRE